MNAKSVICFVCLLGSATSLAQVPILHEVQVVFDELSSPETGTNSPDGKHLYVAAGNAVLVFALNSLTGELSPIEIERDELGGVQGLATAHSVAVSPDGKHVYATGRVDSALAVFERDSSTGELEFVTFYKDGIGGIDGLQDAWWVTLSPDGKHVYVAGFNDDAIAVFTRNETTGELTLIQVVREFFFQDLFGITYVEVSPDGKHVYATGSFRNTIMIYSRDASTGLLTYIDKVQNSEGGISSLASPHAVVVSPDGAHVYASGRFSDAIVVFARNATTGLLTLKQQVRDGENGVDGLNGVTLLQFSPDGNHLYAAGSLGHALAVFSRNSDTGLLSFVQAVKDGEGGVDGLSFATGVVMSTDGEQVFGMGQNDNAIAVFTREDTTGELTWVEQVRGELDGLNDVAAIAVSMDGKHAYTAAKEDDALAVFERFDPTGELSQVQVLRDDVDGAQGLDAATGVAIPADGAHVYVTAEEDNSVAVYSRNDTTGELTFLDIEIDGAGGGNDLGGPTDVVVSPDGKSVYVAAMADRAITTFSRNTTSGLLSSPSSVSIGLGGSSGLFEFFRINVSPDGKNLYATLSNLDRLVVYARDETTGALTSIQTLDDDGTLGINGACDSTVSSDGKHVYVIGQDDNLINVFNRDASTGELTFEQALQVTPDWIGGEFPNSVAVSPQGTLVYATARVSSTLAVFTRDPETGRLNKTEEFFDGEDGIDGLAYAQTVVQSPDGVYTYVSAALDDAISVFELDIFAEVSGRLLDAATDTPIVCGAIELANADRSVVRAAATDENGIYFVERLTPGTYTARIFALGSEETAGEAFVVNERERLVKDYPLILAPLETGIRGVVTDEDSGKPLVATLVELWLNDVVIASTYTCASGAYQFADLGLKGTSDVALSFTLDNYDVADQDAQVITGQVTEVDQPLAKSFAFPATLTGVIYGRDAVTLPESPLPNATVTIRGPVNATRTTDGSGQYSFEAVLDGSYTIRASRQRYTGESVERVISGGVASVKSFLLERIPSPSINVSTNSIDAPPEGGVFPINVTNTGDDDLQWFTNVNPVAPWLSLVAAKLDGEGTVTATVQANETFAPRSTVIYIVSPTASNNPVAIPVNQDFNEPPPLLGVDTTLVQLPAAGGSEEIAVTNQGGGVLDWDAGLSLGANWVTMTIAKRGAPATITLAAEGNETGAIREATVTLISTNAANGPIQVTVRQLRESTGAGGGDLNEDGSFNAIDVQLVINVVLQLDMTTNGDANDDGQVNASDIQFVINKVLGT